MPIRSSQNVDPKFNMSSMTDLVFLLLIFFILTSTLVSVNALKIELPSAQKSNSTPSYTTVNIDETGAYFVNNKAIADFEELERSILEAIQQSGDSSVVVRADKRAQIDELVNVMNIAQKQDLNMVLATEIESN
ncbi:MAG: ExbD/TolR family protein [Flavobacteriales bacterium]